MPGGELVQGVRMKDAGYDVRGSPSKNLREHLVGISLEEKCGIRGGKGEGCDEPVHSFGLVRPNEAAQPKPFPVVARIDRVPVDANPRGHLGHPLGERHAAAPGFAFDDHRAVGRAKRSGALVDVPVSIPDEEQPGAGSDLDEGERTASRMPRRPREPRQEHGGPAHFVGLHPPRGEKCPERAPLLATEGAQGLGGVACPRGIARYRGIELRQGMYGSLQQQKVDGREEKIRRGLALRGVGRQLEQLRIFRDRGGEPAVEGRSPTLDFRETPKLGGQEIERRRLQSHIVTE